MGRILGIPSWHEARRQRKSRGDPSSETEERHVCGKTVQKLKILVQN
jgi:hypothetical protein